MTSKKHLKCQLNCGDWVKISSDGKLIRTDENGLLIKVISENDPNYLDYLKAAQTGEKLG